MTDADVVALNRARAALARRCNAIAVGLGEADLASVKAADDLTRVLLAIEAVDRALTNAGRPYMPEAAVPQAVAKPQAQTDSQDGPVTSASRAKERVKAAVKADRERQPSRRLPRDPSV